MRARLCLWLLVLVAAPGFAQSLTRGPYLQLATPTAITIVFRTDRPGLGRVRYGLAGQALSQTVVTPAASTEHVLRLTGLMPSTRYQYSVELDGATLASGPAFRFRTHPPAGAVEAFRLFAWGDSGTATAGQLRVAQRMAGALNDAALSLILGDIIYPDGAPQDYDPKFFQPYAELSRRMVIWPIIGNHDVGFDPLGRPWLDAFHTPANNPISTELYYSFDYANAHLVVLDTHVNSFSAGSAQLRWAAADLAASTATWKIVAFHVPPYTGGTHTDSASVQANILPVLEAAGVDLVFAGHSHVYERTYLLRQNAIVQNNPSSYSKPTATTGTLYVVSGTAGQSGALANSNHPLMAFQLGGVLGTSIVDFSGNVAHGYFLKDDGSAVDVFQVAKGADTRAPALVAARAVTSTQLEAVFDEPVQAGTGPSSAERVGAWSISPPVVVSSAVLGSDQRTVRLTTAAQAPAAYTLTATMVADRAAPPNTLATAVVPYVVAGDAGVPDAGVVDAGVAPIPDGGVQFVGLTTPLRYLVGASAAPAAWSGFVFDDSVWALGRQPIGYGEPGLATTVTMGSAATLFTRFEFDLFVEPADVRGLTLEVDYDDGFVAYLNGREVARRGVAPNQTHLTLATAHESGVSEVFNLPGAASLLRTGDNFLAIEVHNTALTSSDLFLETRLWANAIIVQADAGARPNDDDGGTPDAGAPTDAGTPVDAGDLTDAGDSMDAGSPVDAGDLTDAGGAMDAGSLTDAGALTADGGSGPEQAPIPPGCGCRHVDGLALAALLLLLAGGGRRSVRAG